MVYFLGCLHSSFLTNHLMLSGLYRHRIGCQSATVFSPFFAMNVTCSLSVIFLWQTGRLKFSDADNNLCFFAAFTTCCPGFLNLLAQSNFLCKLSASLLSLSPDVWYCFSSLIRFYRARFPYKKAPAYNVSQGCFYALYRQKDWFNAITQCPVPTSHLPLW